MSFAKAVAFVLQQEGSDLVDDPKDPGGISRFGIALNRHPELTADDIRKMTPERAASIYSAQYWERIEGDQLADALQLPMLDCAVLQGPETAVRCLQGALYISVDGILGPGTLGTARRADPVLTLARFAAGRIARFEADAAYARFGDGWRTRAVLASLKSIAS